MPKAHKHLIDADPSQAGIRSYLVDGGQVSATLCIPDALREAAKDEAALHGTGFSVFVRARMIEVFAKKGC